ncbi:acyl-CoA dehydrogenase family protein [Phenylobacterium sp. 20VBR1]|uniref:Acyl-CoA dehydrogenase family protein n=1 Tax=Phenylobacterium glaciei TaxID=2803784 RepID=A0A941HX68_9CAUL|nr:acyl-CoA dehydrogenase family protein [Phenylobacterium glaciei]MBR7620583.1 acyl-CoA dehydrogenase family protein [Phenylobacterium glaciei]
MADFGGDLDLEEFRGEAKTWLEANFPASLKGKGFLAATEVTTTNAELKAWRKAIGLKGWATPTWPAEYGGGGLSPQHARVLAQEMAKIGAFNPLMFGMGVTMIGPTIMDYGTNEQKQQHIPPIVRGDVQWCVGYSEPGAGSDLASLQMKCEDAGDHYVINGQKTWTSGAQYSDWCGALVRTDFSAKKHEGISFMLIDMHQKAIDPRPIALIAGASPFCETFFTEARAEKNGLLGPLNGGWTVGKRLLQHERASQTGTSGGGRTVPLNEIAKRYVEVDADGRIADLDLRTRLTKHLMDARIHGLTLARVVAESKEASGATNGASVLKNSATVVSQGRAELTLEIMGHQGLGWQGAEFNQEEIETVRGWLSGKAMSIYGGSVEIQNNIISKRILNLPDNTQST